MENALCDRSALILLPREVFQHPMSLWSFIFTGKLFFLQGGGGGWGTFIITESNGESVLIFCFQILAGMRKTFI